ncbi:MAG: bifunctional helix-turn-helix transcriptional regulator/GNAT family N-acetyltransferase [Erythrobacter sp.]|uniref:bifunctional helix-turn-helix transcriptional regulator/GNAT family N-acetyltransferase n=1 Tax=Erythrobacter sp. TaxID=1042 RepID=UPI0025EF32E7|nr:bifunctional helix-turn-helix transcriptional regulator/GNAT family N-acetyltransferase [Erythrobacter sp.]MCL9998451.1 bifunctional helix-turn-helix transcriptional regulator/GNAT family N-acetyltransferase [Erythrobacter sp.]
MADVVAQMGPAFLGSRLKRLGERMQAGAGIVTASAGLALQPGHMAVLAALRGAPLSVGQLAEACGTSQPGATRTLGQLRDLGMIDEVEAPDQRSRVVTLSPKGREAAIVLMHEVWPRVGMAAQQILDRLDGDFLAGLTEIERALSEASIGERGLRVTPGPLRLREYDDALAHHFHDINADWIEAMFRLEATDREVLENPRSRIVEPGGCILFVEAPGLGIVGTCALQKTGPGAFELTKMGVRETARGLKVGEFLLEAIIARAQAMGARQLYLLTNHICAAAIHLYEKLGFVHDAGIMADYGARYERCDVAMLYKGR